MTYKELKYNFIHGLMQHYPEEELKAMFRISIEETMGLTSADYVMRHNDQADLTIVDKIQHITGKLKDHVPLQYILGTSGFYGMRFKVTPDVLIPRPETEELVDRVIRDHTGARNLNIVDIGTGSGCIAIALKKGLPGCQVDAIDVSPEALAVARENAQANNVLVNWLKADVFDDQWIGKQYDIIVSNPPYIPHAEAEMMEKNVVDHEPHLALFVENKDPMIFYRRIFSLATTCLKTKGKVYVELNENMGIFILDIIDKKIFTEFNLSKDLSNKERMFSCTKI